MPVVVNVLGRGACTFLQARVGENVHNHMVVGADEALDGGKPGRPPGRIQHDLAPMQELGDDLFQLERMPGVAQESC